MGHKNSFYFGIVIFLVCVVLGIQANGQDQQQNKSEDREVKSDTVLIQSHLDEAGKLNNRGEVEKARNHLNEAMALADSLSNPFWIKKVEVELGNYFLMTNNIDSAEVVLKRASDRMANDGIQLQVLNLLGTVYRYQSKYQESLEVYSDALALVDTLKQPDRMAAISTNKAVVYENMGDFSEAISLYHKGIEFAEATGDSIFLATALNNLGEAYNDRSDYESARQYLKESLSISKALGLKNSMLLSYNNLGNTERFLGNYEKALELYQQGLSLHSDIRPDTPALQLSHNLGRLYADMGELDEAEKLFRESMSNSEEMGIPDGRFHNLMGLAEVAEKRGNADKASEYYRQAFSTGEEIGSAPFQLDAAENLYELHKAESDFEQALYHFEQYKRLSDSLSEEQQNQRLATAETELGLRRQQQINQLLEDRQQQQEEQITAQNWLIVSFAVVIVVVLISLYLLYRSNAERKRINAKLVEQQRDLEELNKIKDKMLAILAHDLRSPITSMKGMLYLLREEELTNEEIQEMAAELEVSVNENISMMDNLLAWAREQMSGLSLAIKPVNVAEVVESVIDNYEFQARNKGVSLHNNVSADLKVKADFNLLKLILRNLLANSIKFSNREDTITISAREQGKNVIFEVEDTGIGIPEEKQEQIFAESGKSRTGTQNEKGSGLGLQLCKEFVEKQNGEISLESTVGKGTTFMFSLPGAR